MGFGVSFSLSKMSSSISERIAAASARGSLVNNLMSAFLSLYVFQYSASAGSVCIVKAYVFPSSSVWNISHLRIVVFI